MSIPVWEVLEGHANTVEGQEHKPYRDLVNGNGQPLDLVGVMRECATILREDYERRCGRLARNARSVSPQADSIHFFQGVGNCQKCGQAEWSSIHNVPKHMDNRATKPLVSPERVTAIKAFRRSLALLEEAYGVKLSADSDGSGDMIIVDQTRKIPRGYYYDGRIDSDGVLDIADWIIEDGVVIGAQEIQTQPKPPARVGEVKNEDYFDD